MPYKNLWLLIEGNDDERFLDAIVKPMLEKKYNAVCQWKYAGKNKKQISNFLKSIKAMKANYIFFGDINHTPCVTKRKQSIKNRSKNISAENIIIVIKEIESWYLAGLDNVSSKKIGLTAFKNTDNVSKERFNSLIPQKFASRIVFIQEILKCFNIEFARRRNNSFRYFLEKYDC